VSFFFHLKSLGRLFPIGVGLLVLAERPTKVVVFSIFVTTQSSRPGYRVSPQPKRKRNWLGACAQWPCSTSVPALDMVQCNRFEKSQWRNYFAIRLWHRVVLDWPFGGFFWRTSEEKSDRLENDTVIAANLDSAPQKDHTPRSI